MKRVKSCVSKEWLQTRFQHTTCCIVHRYNDGCEADQHEALVHKLIEVDKVDFMFGSTPVFAEMESVIANNASRLMYHCCVGPDVLYDKVCTTAECAECAERAECAEC